MGKTKGFTLLEAIVAMVIISVLSMSLYGWLNVSYVSSTRAVNTLEKSDVLKSAQAFMQAVNPMEQPKGVYQIGDYFIRWSSEPITNVTPAYVNSRPSLFDVALFEVKVDLLKGTTDSEGVLQGSYTLELIGHHRAREPFL